MSLHASNALLTRAEFRNGVFDRDQHSCVICGAKSADGHQLDAHHVMERRLWPDGGYYLQNGATLCSTDHMLAEQTALSCEQIRAAAGITKIILPSHLYDDFEYTKWGDIILPNGTRLRGELFYDESVQKVLGEGGMLSLYTTHVKHPRTHHLPWSNPTKDDKIISSLSRLLAEPEIIVSVKMDGEQTTMYSDHIHARSLDMLQGEDRSWVLGTWQTIRADIPPGWRVGGENLQAKHSIHYRHLSRHDHPYFYLWAVWNERNECLSWDETTEWAQMLGLQTVPILYRGPFNEAKIKALYSHTYGGDECEGYVVRPSRSFTYGEFKDVVAKYVRPHHVATSRFWRHGALTLNEIAKED